jgi:PAS domain S-box-containing protein
MVTFRAEGSVMLESTRALLSKLPVAIVLISEPGAVVWANPRACELLGQPLAQLVDRLTGDIVHPDDRRQAFMRVGSIMSGDHGPPIRYRALRPNGVQVDFSAESAAADIDGETLIVTVLRELTPGV